MIIVRNPDRLDALLQERREKGKRIGFVPTMGALHEGHAALIRACAAASDFRVCSIFVNPTQFNQPSDFQTYPVSRPEDIRLLSGLPADLLFLPSTEQIYPNGLAGLETYDLGYLDSILEGAYRPGHFQGVCQVMSRLLTLVQPDELFMGQKDYQQCMVIKKLLRLMNLPTRFHTVPTVRESDGLAMSSRNRRIRPEHRPLAPLLHRALQGIRRGLSRGDLGPLRKEAAQMLEQNGFVVDYVEIADAENLQLQHHWDGNRPLVALAAAFLGDVRLIDNLLLGNAQG